MQLNKLLKLPLYTVDVRFGKRQYIDPVSQDIIDPVDDIDIDSYDYNRVDHLRYMLDKHGDISATIYGRFLQIKEYFQRITQDYHYFNHNQCKEFRSIVKYLLRRTKKLRHLIENPNVKTGKWRAPDKLLSKLKNKFIRAQFDSYTVSFIECYSGGILYLINQINRSSHNTVSAEDLNHYDYLKDIDEFIVWFETVGRE